MAAKNTYKKTITVISTEENPIPVDILADHIKSVADAMKRIDASRLKRRAILLLLKDMCPNVNIGQIDTILDAMADLSKRFLK